MPVSGLEPMREMLDLDRLDLLSELTHPVRGAIVRRLREPASVAELAEVLEVPVTRLYHHVNRLVEEGMIRVIATRRSGSVRERRYQAVARGHRIAPELLDRVSGVELGSALGSLFDVAKVGLLRELELGTYRGEDLLQVGMVTLDTGRLTPERRTELLRRMRSLLNEFSSEEEGEPFTFFVAGYPDPHRDVVPPG